MSGTPFTTGQLGKLQSIVSIGVTTALPKVAAKFDPKEVLKALEGKGEIFAQRLESALAQAIGSMLLLAPCKPFGFVSKIHNPDVYYRTRSGLYVWDDFRERVVSKAVPVSADTKFDVAVFELTRDATDEKIESALPEKHLFDESALCAIIAEMISRQPKGEAGDLLNNGYANLFYTSSCVVLVRWYGGGRSWGVDAWRRGGRRWDAGRRVLSPGN